MYNKYISSKYNILNQITCMYKYQISTCFVIFFIYYAYKHKEWTGKTIYLDFSSIFGEFFWDFCRVIEKESKKTDEKGRVRAGI